MPVLVPLPSPPYQEPRRPAFIYDIKSLRILTFLIYDDMSPPAVYPDTVIILLDTGMLYDYTF